MNIAIRDLSPAGFQELNQRIYLVANDRFFATNSVMAARIHNHQIRVLKAVRKGNHKNTPYHLAMAFSWSMALANRFHIDVGDELWKRFPGVCPYCGYVPCGCKLRRVRRKKVVILIRDRPHSLQGYQAMFARIYPNSLQNAAMHFAEEVGEVNVALENFMGMHDEKLVEEVILELVDTITTIFAVATAVNCNLAVEMERWFAHGCPGCHKLICKCGFKHTSRGSYIG